MGSKRAFFSNKTQSDGANRSANSILTLDKSTEPWPVQIAKASRILNIDLDTGWNNLLVEDEASFRRGKIAVDPRIDWTLKWLLKRLEPQGDQPTMQCCSSMSWVLLKELVILCKTATVARLFRVHRFISILEATFRLLRDSPVRALENLQSEEHSAAEDSSSDTLSNDQTETFKKSTKDGSNLPSSAPASPANMMEAFTAACYTLQQVVSLTTLDRTNHQDYAAEHLKHALKSSPHQLANVLSGAFSITNNFLQMQNRKASHLSSESSQDSTERYPYAYQTWLSPTIDLWKLHLKDLGNLSAHISDRAFISKCTIPALQFLHMCHASSSRPTEISRVRKSIESLLLTHVVLPMRANFMGKITQKGLAETEAADSFPRLSDELVPALNDESLTLNSMTLRSHELRDDKQLPRYFKITLLSLFFEVATRARPRPSQKIRQLEDPWLEQVFLELEKCATSILPTPPAVNAEKNHKQLLKWLLQRSYHEKVQLSLITLGHVLEKGSGLFDDASNVQFEWRLISLCLSIDADLLVLPDKNAKSVQPYSYKPPNKYLIATLAAITLPLPGNAEEQQFVVHNVIIPLLDGFCHARDVPGFIEHWKEQLSIVEQRRELMNCEENDIPFDNSSWEDEALLAAVANSLESLTGEQVREILDTAFSNFKALIQDKTKGKALQDIVVFDCVFRGIATEQNTAKLAKLAESVFIMLESTAKLPGTWPLRYRWRLWRIMTSIISRWSPKLYPQLKSSTQLAICHAFEIISRIPEWQSREDLVDHAELQNAFIFLSSLAWLDDQLWRNEIFSSRERALEATRKVLAVMQPFCQKVELDIRSTFMNHSENTVTCFRPGVPEYPAHTLYLNCMQHALCSPKVFDTLEPDIVQQIIEQSYVCALFHQRASLPPSDVVDYSWPWHYIVSDNMWWTKTENMKLLRTFQIKRYLQASHFDDPDHWNINSADYNLATRSLLTIPVEELSRESRVKLSNRVLQVLLYADMGSLADITVHIILLEKLIERPSKTMCILNNKKILTSEEPESEAASNVALLKIAQTVDRIRRWSTDKINCIEALGHLTRRILSYLFSNLDGKDTTQHIQVFYGRLASLLEGVYSNGDVCGSAFSTVAAMTLRAFHQHYDELPMSLRDDLASVADTRRFHLQYLLSLLRLAASSPSIASNLSSSPNQRHDLGVVLDCMIEYADLLRIHSGMAGENRVSERLTHLSQSLWKAHAQNTVTSPSTNNEICDIEYLGVRSARLHMALSEGDEGLLTCIAEVSSMLNPPDASRDSKGISVAEGQRIAVGFPNAKVYITHHIQEVISTLEPGRKARLLDTILKSSVIEYLDDGKLYLLRAIILSAKKEEVQELRPSMSRCFTSLCKSLWQCNGFRRSMLSMHCISAILQRLPGVVTQWHIDSLLATIAITSRQLKSKTMEKSSAMLYTGLCRLCLAILKVHRAKIGGRYHLVVPALQDLLRCLFRPYSRSVTEPETTCAFTEQQAADYCRILTTLCDPTVSSVTRSKKRSYTELNDETKKARSMAGQHLPYLIMEYCRCQLEERLTPDMKRALNAGLWAVLEVTSKDGMRTMNAAMDSSSRSVFKALYDDFSRLGKWDGG